jgi:protein involved in sex pheromone biosynthesis
MKNKIIVLLAVAGMFMAASCGEKKSTETQEAVKSDSTVVKSDSTAAITPKDSVKSN